MNVDINIDANKAKFMEIYQAAIKRTGSDKFIKWLEKTDFFTAPYSTKGKLANPGGLCLYSLNVYENLLQEVQMRNNITDVVTEGHVAETLAICGLLHSVCKAKYYKVKSRNIRDASGELISVPYYEIEDKIPLGFGEKSVYLISYYMKLKPYEAVAIRWYLGGFDDSVKSSSFAIGNAFRADPLAVALHIATLKAAYFDGAEKEDEDIIGD